MNDFIVFKHLYEDKEKWWGKGEWVSEPDHVKFIYKDYMCTIKRIVAFEGQDVFGGHLCCYVQVPECLKLFEFCDINYEKPYKNLDFCIKECKNLVDQIIEKNND